ncbi:23S rRNA (uridine(2479)-2'-O)-methyltransferase [Botrimarina hoheduenensis]|uniref:23S rRNA (Uridine(2479)-2'-O)-methyltransferase n=1 Tax=Botrimarina hoheduenensis TaxID=2528000 RepID=A0A5C5WCT9_9BACT|nr:23S rRNA (uridine(2479)-2'-O)-methyltransferase [Botrimarina hoheduenensis]
MKQAARLRDSRQRRKTGLLLVDGARETLRALQAGVTPVEAFVLEGATGPRITEACQALEVRGVPLVQVAADPFSKLAFGDRADGVVLVAQRCERPLQRLRLPPNPLLLIVERIEKPGNLGAILRTADGAGIDAVVAVDPLADFDNPNVIRASVGAAFREGIAAAPLDETLAWLAELGVQLVVTRPDASAAYTTIDYREPTAIVLGNEADGLSAAWDRLGATAVSLPMHGIADSLNVSTTAAVLAYEARRQRDTP